MKLLTFLGTGKNRYTETCYCWRDQEFTTKYAPTAACHFLNVQEVVVFLTKEAREEVFDDFVKSLPAHVSVTPVEVPLGRTESELWEIFEQVRLNVLKDNEKEDEIAFDITLGMRSSPWLSLLAIAFLKSGFGVKLVAVLYGAFETKTGDNKTPVFDLTPMLALLEWSAAADRFNRTGDARYLAKLLKNYQKELALRPGIDQVELSQLSPLNGLASNLTGLSQSLQMIRPSEAMQFADQLGEKVRQAEEALTKGDSARPFQALLGTVLQTYQPLAYPYPDQIADVDAAKKVLAAERSLIHWYYEREWWVQAVSLAREWLISWLMVQTGNFNIRNQSKREIYEHLLGAESKAFTEAKQANQEYRPVFLSQIAKIEQVLGFWPNLTKVRNDTLHAGQREDAQKADSLVKQLKDLITELDSLPL